MGASGTRSVKVTSRRAQLDVAPARVRHLHERVLGAALRAGALSLAPALGALALGAAGVKNELLAAAAATFAASFVLFLLERRAAKSLEVLGRALLAGVAGSLLVPAVIACAHAAGSPTEIVAAIAALLRRADDLGGVAFVVGLTSPVWALLLFVRARTARVWPQALAGALTGLPLAIGLGVADHRGGSGLTLLGALAFATIGGLALGLAEARLAPRVDPAAPAPVERGVGGLLGLWTLAFVLGAGVVVPNLVSTHCHCGDGPASAIGSLRAILTAQTMFSQSDKDHDGQEDYAGSLAELALPAHGALIDAALGTGTKRNYTFTLVRDEAAPTLRWCVTADPIDTDLADRRFWMREDGKIFSAVATTTPALTPSATSGPPAGWTPVGK